MFAPFIAEELEIRRIVIPSIPPGVFSAWGMLNTDILHSTIHTYITRLDSPEAVGTMNRMYGELEDEILEVFRSEGIEGPIILERYADIRYYGQEHTVRVPVKAGELSREDVDATIDGFHEAHERECEFKLVGDPVEIVNFQVVGVKKVEKLELSELHEGELDPEEAFLAEREVFINGGYEGLPVYDRTKLGRGATIRGPAILEDPTATIILLHVQEAVVDRYGNIRNGRVR